MHGMPLVPNGKQVGMLKLKWEHAKKPFDVEKGTLGPDKAPSLSHPQHVHRNSVCTTIDTAILNGTCLSDHKEQELEEDPSVAVNTIKSSQ